MNARGKVLFVDDEKRVLNSMRGLFRREYDLLLTTDGAEAVQLVSDNDVDVIVADQRMPGLSGVEVLGKVREVSPRTVRILLTGYADPEAIEGSINIGEVFRFLSKPCQPKLLRETVELAIAASRVANTAVVRRPAPPALPDAPAPTNEHRPAVSQPAAPPPAPTASVERSTAPASPPTPPQPTVTRTDRPTPVAAESAPPNEIPSIGRNDEEQDHWHDRTEIVMSGETSQEIRRLELPIDHSASMRSVGVAVFTVNPTFAESAIRTISSERSTTLATTLVKVAEVLEQREAGVLLTDFTSDTSLLQNMIGALKRHLPELVTIVVSENRDATDMINLINYGQVFRYVEKPVDATTLRMDINAAVMKHLQLLEHPELIQRHQVLSMASQTGASPTLNQFIGKVTGLRGRWASTDKSH